MARSLNGALRHTHTHTHTHTEGRERERLTVVSGPLGAVVIVIHALMEAPVVSHTVHPALLVSRQLLVVPGGVVLLCVCVDAIPHPIPLSLIVAVGNYKKTKNTVIVVAAAAVSVVCVVAVVCCLCCCLLFVLLLLLFSTQSRMQLLPPHLPSCDMPS